MQPIHLPQCLHHWSSLALCSGFPLFRENHHPCSHQQGVSVQAQRPSYRKDLSNPKFCHSLLHERMLNSNLPKKSHQKFLVPTFFFFFFFNLHALGGLLLVWTAVRVSPPCRLIQAGLASPGPGTALCHSEQLQNMFINCDHKIRIEKNIKLYTDIFSKLLQTTASCRNLILALSKIKWQLLCSIVITELLFCSYLQILI